MGIAYVRRHERLHALLICIKCYLYADRGMVMLDQRKIHTTWVSYSNFCLTYKRLPCIYQLSWWSGYNPQFKLVVNVPENKTAAVWLLMSKHITVTEQKNTDFITLHVYNDTNGERVYHHGKALKEGTYVNSPHILVIIFKLLPSRWVNVLWNLTYFYSCRFASMRHREHRPIPSSFRSTKSSRHSISHWRLFHFHHSN